MQYPSGRCVILEEGICHSARTLKLRCSDHFPWSRECELDRRDAGLLGAVRRCGSVYLGGRIGTYLQVGFEPVGLGITDQSSKLACFGVGFDVGKCLADALHDQFGSGLLDFMLDELDELADQLDEVCAGYVPVVQAIDSLTGIAHGGSEVLAPGGQQVFVAMDVSTRVLVIRRQQKSVSVLQFDHEVFHVTDAFRDLVLRVAVQHLGTPSFLS